MIGRAVKLFMLIEKLNYIMRWFGLGCLLFLTGLVVNEVVMRFVFNNPLGLTVELARTIQIYLGFLCAGYVQSIKAHLNMESLFDYVGPKARKITLISGSLLGAIYCAFMGYESWVMFVHSVRTSEVTLMLEWPMGIVKIPTAIGFSLLGAQFVIDAWKSYRNLEDRGSAEETPDLSS